MINPKSDDDKMLEEFLRIKFESIRTVADSIINATIQFFYDNSKGEEKLTGSGVLFEIDDKHFVFTAAHVIAENIEDVYFIVPFQAINCGGILYHVSLPISGSREEDKYDLAVIELDPIIAATLKQYYQFLELNDILIGHTVDEFTRYLAVGYPATRTQKIWGSNEMKSEPFVFNSKPVVDFEYNKFGFNFESHLAIEFKGKVISENSYQTQSSPQIKGISGSGMWYLPNFPEIDEIQTKKLIGITIEQINKPNNQAIVVARIDLITEFLRQHLKIKGISQSKNIKINIR